ncbi:reverse transcriptase domain-containing protein [Tanacetum coccineum]
MPVFTDVSLKIFSKIDQPLTKLLEKDTPFEFDDECQKAFELLKKKLTCAPVIVSPNWNLLFKLMRDASDFAVGAILEIKDRKGTKNVIANHLSRIENDESSEDSEMDDNFPKETLMEINTKNEPWFVDFANYLVDDIIPKGMTYQQRNKFFSDLKHYFWEEPYLFKNTTQIPVDDLVLPKKIILHTWDILLPIIERIGPIAYRLRIPQELSSIHDIFHVSNLKKCLADANLHVPLEEIKVDKTLRFVEEPLRIIDREVKRLKRSRIPIVKVRWNSKQGPEYTWEREDHMKTKYPHLFSERACSDNTS